MKIYFGFCEPSLPVILPEISDLQNMGFKMLIGNLIGNEIFLYIFSDSIKQKH